MTADVDSDTPTHLDDTELGCEDLEPSRRAHLRHCRACRIRRQRRTGTRPAGIIDARPALLEVDTAARPRRGELWTTTACAATIAVVKVRDHNWGITAVPVTFDTNAGPGGRIITADRNPLDAPISVHDQLVGSLPLTALAGRLTRNGQPINLDELDGDPGTPFTGPDDPRHDIHQWLADRLCRLHPITATPLPDETDTTPSTS